MNLEIHDAVIAHVVNIDPWDFPMIFPQPQRVPRREPSKPRPIEEIGSVVAPGVFKLTTKMGHG